MSLLYDVTAPKKATNISINSDLIEKAKAYKINLSKTLEQELDSILRKKVEEKWLEETQDAVNSYNKHIAKNGTFGQQVKGY